MYHTPSKRPTNKETRSLNELNIVDMDPKLSIQTNKNKSSVFLVNIGTIKFN